MTSLGPNGKATIIHSRPSFLQLNNEKSVHCSHTPPEPFIHHVDASFLQKAKRELNRDEIEITPQPLLWKEKDHCFAQLKTKNLKTSKKLWDDFNKVEGSCDDDDDDSKDGIEDNDDLWDVDG